MNRFFAVVAFVATGYATMSGFGLALPANAQSASQETPKDQARERDRAQDRRADEKAKDVHAPRHDIGFIDEVPDTCWAEMRMKRVYFAHGPVGKDLLTGLHVILDERPVIGWKVISYGEAPTKPQNGVAPGPAPFGTPAIVEGPSGADGDPTSKIDRFVAKLRSKEGQDIDVAILTLSAEDFTRETNVESLHRHYVDTLRSITGERPSLRVVHCTVPLATPDRGVAGRMKKMVGRGADQVNAQRGRFNDLLRAEFGREAILDLAHAESERADGTHCTVRVGGVRWPALAAEHVDDSGRLNDEGRIAIAREFALALVRPCVEAHGSKEAEVTVVPGSSSNASDESR